MHSRSDTNSIWPFSIRRLDQFAQHIGAGGYVYIHSSGPRLYVCTPRFCFPHVLLLVINGGQAMSHVHIFVFNIAPARGSAPRRRGVLLMAGVSAGHILNRQFRRELFRIAIF